MIILYNELGSVNSLYVIDIAQTEYIFKPISKQFNQTHLVANMDITKLYLIGA